MSKPNPQTLNLRPVYDDWAWQEKANCRGEDNSIFFLEVNARGETKRKQIASAKKICRSCPVVNECLSHALSVPEHFGVWGGMSADERNVILAKRGIRLYR